MIMFVAFAFGFGVNYYTSHIASAQTNSSPLPNLNIFWEAWGIINKDFYGTVPDKQTLTHGAIRGMLRGLNDLHRFESQSLPKMNNRISKDKPATSA
jgi:hypothetical protein